MHGSALFFLELGGVILLLGLLGRLSARFGFSPIPLYLIGGLAFGEGGLVPIVTSERFIETGATLGVVLLLLMLGLEYTGAELVASLRTTTRAGGVDLVANFVPGFLIGLAFGIGLVPSLFLGGVTYISSSGVVAKLLEDLGWTGNRETPAVLSLLVFEDLAMAVILPILGALALGGTLVGTVTSVMAALAAVGLILLGATRQSARFSRWVFSASDEFNLLTLLGVTLVVAGFAEQLSVSAGVGAFLVGIGVSGEAAHRAKRFLEPLRDLFATMFFVFFGLITDPAVLIGAAFPIVVLAVVTGVSKYYTGKWAARRVGIGVRGQARAGSSLIARGEFSIIIAGLGASAVGDDRLPAIAAGYVIVMATAGPVAARLADRKRAAPPVEPGASAGLRSRFRRREERLGPSDSPVGSEPGPDIARLREP
jgi:CPA2 family monovalent cation:H+ antiporter-2